MCKADFCLTVSVCSKALIAHSCTVEPKPACHRCALLTAACLLSLHKALKCCNVACRLYMSKARRLA